MVGRVRVKQVPGWVSSASVEGLWTEIVPLCFVMICFTTDNPSPTPSYPLCFIFDALKNSSNIFAFSPAGIPIPLSEIFISTSFGESDRVILTLPHLSTYFTAFDMILEKPISNRNLSPRTFLLFVLLSIRENFIPFISI